MDWKINIIKRAILSKVTYRLNVIPINIPMMLFTEKKSWNLYRDTKDPQIDKAILRKKNKAGAIKLPDFILYYTAIVVKTVWYGHNICHKDQWDRIQSPEINLHTYMVN